MAKLPWYVKDNGAEFIGGQIFVNLKIRRIYIIWVMVQVFFALLFDKVKKTVNNLTVDQYFILMVFLFFGLIIALIVLCNLFEWIIQ